MDEPRSDLEAIRRILDDLLVRCGIPLSAVLARIAEQTQDGAATNATDEAHA